MANPEELDEEARVALAIIEGHADELDAETTSRNLDLIAELEGLRDVRAVFDTPSGTGGPPRKPAPFPTWGPFVLKEEIGRGAFGVVCRAHDPATARDVAVKLYEGTEIPAEPRLMGRVRHPNVVAVF